MARLLSAICGAIIIIIVLIITCLWHESYYWSAVVRILLVGGLPEHGSLVSFGFDMVLNGEPINHE